MKLFDADIRIAVDGRVLVDVRGFRIPHNRITMLFGESGIGKSLIARALYGLLDPEEFDVTVNNEPYDSYLARPEIRSMREHSFFVFQEPSSHLTPLLTLRDQLNEGTLAKAPPETELLRELWTREGSSGEATSVPDKLLDIYPKPHRPSGGEKQRMFLVMALKKIDMMLAMKHTGADSVFVFDEPTGSLDNHFRDVFLSMLFRRFRSHPFTVLLITHDYSMISEMMASHADLREKIAFKELKRSDRGLTMAGFEGETYMGWLQQQEKRRKSRRAQATPLLAAESRSVVHGRELIISRDEAGKNECPLEVHPGTIASLKAPSGEGKTTFLKMIMGLLKADFFRLSLNGKELSHESPGSLWRKEIWGKSMTMVFQHADEALNPGSRVREIFEGLPVRGEKTTEMLRTQLGRLFDEDLSDRFLNTPVSFLSGGQKQRLNLARALALKADVVLLDEPFNGLDFDSITRVFSLLEELQQEKRGFVLVSHNEEIVRTLVSEENTYYLRARTPG
jgi:peptide/nickel transport system ATP-binding protein